MKIIFTSFMATSPSFLFYASSLAKINGRTAGICIDIINNPLSVDYSAYDVALFMGSSDGVSKAKTDNPSITVGVVEPRVAQNQSFSGLDFIIVNSIEAKDFFSRYCHDLIIYYTFPEVPPKLDCPIKKDRLVLGYHGNLLHLDAMYPRITQAVAELAKKIPLELWAMYNIETLGKWQKADHKDLGFPVVHIQYSEENYARYLAHADIGLVPQLIPVRENRTLRCLIGSISGKYNERFDNYFLRFKETTNIGRHLVFAQYGIPVVSDMTPSSCAFIHDENDGFVAFHSESWSRALELLAFNRDLRIEMGNRLKEKYLKTATHEKMNESLISFLKSKLIQKETSEL